MTLREFIISRVHLYFILVALIFAVSMGVGLIFTPDRAIYYYQLIGPFILAGMCVLPTLVTYFRKEPTLGQYSLRHAIQLLLIEGIVLTQIQPPENGSPVVFYIVMGAAVPVVYLLASLLMWLQKLRESKKLTEQLKLFQEDASH